ncbi:MAG TPA: phosphotransferase family protein [Acidimicrobiia bacterium]|nr:phosphotransferase family protein [Acidimicrobiia bacterium]
MADDAPIEPGEMTTPWRRDLDELGALVQAWARANVSGDAHVSGTSAPGNGLSSETVLFDMTAGGEFARYAARLAPMPDVYPVFPEYDIDKQRRCMQLVRAHTDVPAPNVRWTELDPKWLGAPFLVMDRIDGDAPPDLPPYVFGGWVMDATPAERATLQESSIEVLAELHRITPDTADLSFLMRPEHGDTALRQQLGHERAYYEWAREGVQYPLIDRTFAWLEAHWPEEGAPVLNWGDARIGNVLYRDFRPVAVLDWEMATVGPREVDLAWMIFLHTFFADLAQRFEMPPIVGFMQRDDVVRSYERRTGHTVQDSEWFEVFAALRFAIVSVRTTTRNIAYGQQDAPADPDDLIFFRELRDRMLA